MDRLRATAKIVYLNQPAGAPAAAGSKASSPETGSTERGVAGLK